MSLTHDLESLKRESAGRIPPFALTLFDNLIKDLKARNFEQTALKVGDHIPTFVLSDALGRMVS